MTPNNARLLELLPDEVGLTFDQNRDNTVALAAAMGWRTGRASTQVARALESLRREGYLVQEKRKSWYEPKRWRVVEKAKATA